MSAKEIFEIISVFILLTIPILIIRHFSSDYDKCYANMEDSLIASFGCCKGINENEMCANCPYHTRIGDLKNDE